MTTKTTSYTDGVVDVVKRWLNGPLTFSSGSFAAGSATEDRARKEWLDKLRQDIAWLRTHPDSTPEGRATLNAILGPRGMPASVVATTIVDLGSERFALRVPLVVVLEFHDDEVVASWPEVEVWGCGAGGRGRRNQPPQGQPGPILRRHARRQPQRSHRQTRQTATAMGCGATGSGDSHRW